MAKIAYSSSLEDPNSEIMLRRRAHILAARVTDLLDHQLHLSRRKVTA